MSQRYYKTKSISEDGEIVYKSAKSLYSPFREGRGYNFKYKSTFIKSYLGISLPIEKVYQNSEGEYVYNEGFNDLELGRLYRISKLMYSNTNLLARRIDTCIVPYTRDDIQEEIGVHRTRFVPFWKKVFEFGVIKETQPDGRGISYFCVNPLYFNTTTYIPLYLFLAFQKELKSHIPEWALKKYLEMRSDVKYIDAKEGSA